MKNFKPSPINTRRLYSIHQTTEAHHITALVRQHHLCLSQHLMTQHTKNLPLKFHLRQVLVTLNLLQSTLRVDPRGFDVSPGTFTTLQRMSNYKLPILFQRTPPTISPSNRLNSTPIEELPCKKSLTPSTVTTHGPLSHCHPTLKPSPQDGCSLSRQVPTAIKRVSRPD